MAKKIQIKELSCTLSVLYCGIYYLFFTFFYYHCFPLALHPIISPHKTHAATHAKIDRSWLSLSWSSKQQIMVALSSTEAEYITAQAIKETI